MTRFRLPLFALFLVACPAVAAEPTFQGEGVAFLKTHCLNCHSGEKPKADLSLSQFTDDASLIKDRKTWNRVREVIQAGEMPPASRPQPTATDREAFTKLVVGVFDHFDKTAKPDPGRVTLRRLNKNEYSHTVRDLCGIDFNAAEDFPSDDVGHGFDNIGDVLSLPPVLLERYLAAAETVMARAIAREPPKVSERWTHGRYTEPAAAKVPLVGDYRILDAAGKTPLETGPVHAPFKMPAGEQYEFRVKMYAETTGKQPVKVALLAVTTDKTVPGLAADAERKKLVGGEKFMPFVVVGTVEVPARTAKDAKELKLPFTPPPGFTRAAVAVVAPGDGEPPPKVMFEYFRLVGPLNTLPPSHRMLLTCDESKPVAERSREVLTRFASRAYRRPATTEEVDRLMMLADAATARGDKWEAAMQFAMTAALVSPKFLFRVELDNRPAGPDPRPLSEYQLASRLSYFLWASMPDDELFALAAKGELTKNLDAQVTRMLKSPKAVALVDHFALQWLQLGNLKNFQPDPAKFPKFSESLRAAMFEETKRFLAEIVREDKSILTMLDADYTYVNGQLANHYGIVDTAGNTWRTPEKMKKPGGQKIEWDQFARVQLWNGERGGLLSQASVLAVTSNPTRTSPVKRGKWVLEQLLGTPPPPPPADVPELEKDGKAVNAGTLRQQMELHRKNPACANCHAKMDPLGFGLETFDAVGGFRDKDDGKPIDASGVLPDGQTFNGPAELRQILLSKKDLFTRCLTEKMLTYALGRGLEYYDKRTVDAIVAAVKKGDYKLSVLVSEIAKSDPFRLRRGIEKHE